jgi:hypothetical protein
MDMPIALEAYTADGLLTGSAVGDGRLVDLLAGDAPVIIDSALVSPFDGPPQPSVGWSSIEVDDLLAVVASPETVTPHHAVWHAITVDLGPFRVRGELPAQPGFDPARALARPTGGFILLGQATVELRSEGPAGGYNEHQYIWINRYAVDAVQSDLELGFFFPGAMDPRPQHAIA